MKVLNFGSLNYDYVYSVDHMVRAGETLSSSQLQMFLGGKGFNQSVALAKAGVAVYHAGLVGEDGELFLKACRDYGVDTTYIEQVEGQSGHTIIQVDKHAQNCILLYGGSNQKMTRSFVDRVLKKFTAGDILLLQNEVNELPYIIDQAAEKGLTIVLNPSPYDEKLDRCDFNKISIFLLNEIEGEMMTGSSDSNQILAVMREKYPAAKVVLTVGEAGAVYLDQENRIAQSIFPVTAVDTTAAGDTFTGYFIAGLLEQRPIAEVLRVCAKASSLTVSRKGAADSIPLKEEVENSLYNS